MIGKKIVHISSLLLFLLAAVSLFSVAQEITRFALIAGCNFGDEGSQTLKYATDDAKAISDVLTTIGGVKEDHRILLLNPSLNLLDESFKHLERIIQGAGGESKQVEFIFYYSGHSDTRGLQLFGEHFGFETLKRNIEGIPARVKVIIIDSCSSGAFTRYKGGTITQPFLFDTSNLAEGQAILTSSTEKEDSQESDYIQASFFSHAVVTGLRGAADRNNDKRVTLNEVHEYAFQDTMTKTEKISGGSQHPVYDIQLSGTGNLVLTDLHGSVSRIILPVALYGKIILRDISDKLVAEFRKEIGTEFEMSLGAGAYRVIIENDEGVKTGEFTLRNFETHDLSNMRTKKELQIAPFKKGDLIEENTDEEVQLWKLRPVSLTRYDENENTRFAVSWLGAKNNVLSGFTGSLFYDLLENGGSGYQSSLLWNHCEGPFGGVQFSLGLNTLMEDSHCFQFGAFNYAEKGTGFQLSSFNIARDRVTAGQLSGVFNVAAGSLTGAQVSPVNIADRFKGVQLGVINYAREGNGVQLGVINISRHLDGVPIGLVSIQGNGQNHLDVWNELDTRKPLSESLMHVGFRFGSNYFYKMLRIAFPPEEIVRDTAARTFAGGALGFRIPVAGETAAIMCDIGADLVSQDPDEEAIEWDYTYKRVIPNLRVLVDIKIYRNFGVVIGVINRQYISGVHPDGMLPDKEPGFYTPWGDLYSENRLCLGFQL